MKYIPIALGVLILVLIGVVIFVPGKNDAPPDLPNATSTPNGQEPVSTSTPATSTEPGTSPTSTVYYNFTTAKGRIVRLDIPANALVTSPLRLTGNVPAGWAFEASFPASIVDSTGKMLAQVPASVPNWMSPTGAWFGVNLMFAKPATQTGFIVLKRDNPSDMPENSDEVSIPVRFR